MPDFLMSDIVLLFNGLDTEKWSIRREPCFSGRLDDALRYAMEKLSSDERHGAHIRRENDHRILDESEFEALYKTLKS